MSSTRKSYVQMKKNQMRKEKAAKTFKEATPTLNMVHDVSFAKQAAAPKTPVSPRFRGKRRGYAM